VSDPGPEPNSDIQDAKASAPWIDALGRIGVDWSATIVAGAIAALAVTNLLPTIPW
jgi:hypothetical protein